MPEFEFPALSWAVTVKVFAPTVEVSSVLTPFGADCEETPERLSVTLTSTVATALRVTVAGQVPLKLITGGARSMFTI